METKPMRIEYIEDDEGDWRELILNGETFAANHSIRSSEWIALIEEITGIEVIVTNIPCEDD